MLTNHQPTVALYISCPACRCLHAHTVPCPRCAHEARQRELPVVAWWLLAATVVCATWGGLWWLLGW